MPANFLRGKSYCQPIIDAIEELFFVIAIKIISPTPGPNTTEQILEIIQRQSTGITIKQISDRIQRPVSMIQVCLKNLISTKQIYARKNKMGVGSIYYPCKVK